MECISVMFYTCFALTLSGAELNNTNDKRSDRYFSHCQNVSEWGIWWPVQLINEAWVFSFMWDVRDVYCCTTIICNISSLENYMLTTECIRRRNGKVKVSRFMISLVPSCLVYLWLSVWVCVSGRYTPLPLRPGLSLQKN